VVRCPTLDLAPGVPSARGYLGRKPLRVPVATDSLIVGVSDGFTAYF
jgi:hypothetical protein